jgi:hypothetical protein
MAFNITATYKNIPRETIGPFIATLETFYSSGVTFTSGSTYQLISTTGGVSTGFVEALNVGPTYTILKNDLTHQELIGGYTFNQLRCRDLYLVFQSTDVCYTSYRANLFGANGAPTLRLKAFNNSDGNSVTSSLTVTPIGNATPPSPSTITVSTSSPTVGTVYEEIQLGQGKYDFTFNITSPTPSVDRYVQLEFIECGSL